MWVFMSHVHANDHVYMTIRLIRLLGTSLRFCTKALGMSWDYGTAHIGPFGEIRAGLCVFRGDGRVR
jgi:hypothetical protein